MQEVTMWRANDNTLFEDEEKCREYESQWIKNNLNAHLVKFFDRDQDEITLEELIQHPMIWDDVEYILFKRCGRDADEFMETLFEEILDDFYNPLGYVDREDYPSEDNTILMYDHDEEEWCNITRLQREYNIIHKNIIKKVS